MADRYPFPNLEPLIRRVYAYVAYRIGDGPDADDITSETFERAWRYRENYDRRKGKPAAWLIGIARRCIDDTLAARRTDGELRDETPAPGDLEAETLSRLELGQTLLDLREAVLKLDSRDRELIALRYGADLKAREIAELLGERTNTIEVALHRALGRLRNFMHEEISGDAPASAEESPVRI
jgi:RNA polymerase sigma-70 factor (ECF subfamily)